MGKTLDDLFGQDEPSTVRTEVPVVPQAMPARGAGLRTLKIPLAQTVRPSMPLLAQPEVPWPARLDLLQMAAPEPPAPPVLTGLDLAEGADRTVTTLVETPQAGEPTVADLLKQPFTVLMGPAGTGKTTMAREVLKARPDSTLFCATTGIAAVNLGDAVTLNAALSYFDTNSLKEHYISGFLQYRLRALRRSGIRLILIDELSMFSADQLTILCQAIDDLDLKKSYDQDLEEVRWTADDDGRLKLLLVGDFAQLPPVKEPFAFESPEWARFTTYSLQKIRRQGDQSFAQALQAVRKGKPSEALPIFEPRMVPSLDHKFAGTTIVAKNDQVDRINQMRHAELKGQLCTYKTLRSGEQEKEWIKNIPEACEVKEGALVMILANRPYPKLDDEEMVSGYFYVNGDLATVVRQETNGIRVFLHRTFEEVTVIPAVKEKKEATGKRNPRWNIKGTVTYMPLRLAYATTVHKSQGLTLDNVQVSIVDSFFNSPGMLYVALSRARTLEGLRIVGNPKMFAGRCGVDKRIGRFL